MSRHIRAVDLFCGAGGLSTGLAQACERMDQDVDLAAVNHWGPAIETHKRNYPWADHYHSTIQGLKPVEVFGPETTIKILIAAPSCTEHSPANGGAPTQPQDRMAPFSIFDWVAQLQPDELAAAQGFPTEYSFAGDTKDTVTRQIGNAVPVNLATALCEQLLRGGSSTLEDFADGGEP